jgi:hypothetical protein
MNNNHQIKPNSCYCASSKNISIPDIIHGRITGYECTHLTRSIND